MYAAYVRDPELARLIFRQRYVGDAASRRFGLESTATCQELLAEPFAQVYGERGPLILEALTYLIRGITWDTIISYGADFGGVVEQESFARRVRDLIELALPECPS